MKTNYKKQFQIDYCKSNLIKASNFIDSRDRNRAKNKPIIVDSFKAIKCLAQCILVFKNEEMTQSASKIRDSILLS